MLEYWSTGVLEYWSTGVLEYWSAGVPEYWGAGVLEYWCAGVLVSMVGERAWGFIPPTERIRTGCALGSGWGPAPQSPPGVRWSPPLRVGPLLRVRVLEYWTTGVPGVRSTRSPAPRTPSLLLASGRGTLIGKPPPGTSRELSKTSHTLAKHHIPS